jgi:hypothetical protein
VLAAPGAALGAETGRPAQRGSLVNISV